MFNEVKRLQALNEACREVLKALEAPNNRTDNLFAEAIRETCRQIEARLGELNARNVNRFASQS